jgi:hypothetical protein
VKEGHAGICLLFVIEFKSQQQELRDLHNLESLAMSSSTQFVKDVLTKNMMMNEQLPNPNSL